VEREWDRAKTPIRLPAPKEVRLGALSLREAIERRRSIRAYSTVPLRLDELSYLLWCTQGVQRIAAGGQTMRTVPSAGARHALETLLCVNNVSGLRPGLYRFLALEHALVDENLEPGVADRLVEACLGQDFVKSCAATFVWVGTPSDLLLHELAFRVMLANGGIVSANATTNSDLYWAMRGGTGGNFGVLLSVTYQLFPVQSVWAYAIQWDGADAAAALLEMQTNYMITGAPKELGATINLGFNNSQQVLLMQGMYVGSADDGKQALSSLLAIGSADLNADQSGSYPAMNAYLENYPYVIPNPPDGSSEDKRAGYIKQPLSLSDWQSIVNYAATTPNPANTAIIEPYGGAINAFPKSGSAFIHRDVAMDFFVDVFWLQDTDKQQAVDWLNGFWQLMHPYLNGHVYQNYPHRGLTNFQNAYWGSAYTRLMQVKIKYDPTNVFQFEQSIQPGTLDAASGPIVYELPPRS